MEFSPNGMLAVLIRSKDSGGSIYTIDQDLSSFTRIVIQNLLVEPDPTHAGLATPYILNNIGVSRSPGGYLSIRRLSGPNPFFTSNTFSNVRSNGLRFMRNLDRKISAIEFSPNGDYLYFVNGGYTGSGFTGVSYLCQIELDSAFLADEGNYKVNVSMQLPAGTINSSSGRSTPGFTNNYAAAPAPYTNGVAQATRSVNQISNIQSAIDGNLYFTKTNSPNLWVLPEPNQPLVPRLDPWEINYATPSEANIPLRDGWPKELPDQIDWYNYQETNWTNVDVSLGKEEKEGACGCEEITVYQVDVLSGDTVRAIELNSCADTISFCVENDKQYNLVGSNGTTISNAIVDGVVNYPSWSFDDNHFYSGRFGMVSTSKHNLKVGDVIHVDQDPGFTHASYNGEHTIKNVLSDYIIITDQAWGGETLREGGVVTKRYFDFGTSLGDEVTINVSNQSSDCSECKPISFNIHVLEKESNTEPGCVFPKYIEGKFSGNSNRNYSRGDIISRNGVDYQVIIAPWANANNTPSNLHYAPGTGFHWTMAWKEINNPCISNDSNDSNGQKDTIINYESDLCKEEFDFCVDTTRAYFIEYPSDPGVLHELTFKDGEIVYPNNKGFYDLSGDDGLKEVSFTIENFRNNLSTCEKECAPITVTLYEGNEVKKEWLNKECDTVNVCIDPNKTYALVGSNGTFFTNLSKLENKIFDFSVDYRPFEFNTFRVEYEVPVRCEMVCFNKQIEIVIETVRLGQVSSSTKLINPCDDFDICIDPFYDYYVEFNGVRHHIFDRVTGKAKDETIVFTTEEVSALTCCPMNLGIDMTSEDFLYIKNDIVITQNTTWDNKVYIDSGVTVLVDSSILDITTMDVLFGECAGITFTNGATLRASNSVFRPCDLNKTWRGLKFLNNRSVDVGIINECTFKNAEEAVRIEKRFGGGPVISNVRLTNNLFSNCRGGILFSNILIDKSITGNTFQVDNDKPDFTEYCTNSGFIGGIQVISSGIGAEIAQNDFVNMADNWAFKGIDVLRTTGGSISKNTFTNNFTALSFGMISQISIEDNSVSVTSLAPSGSSNRSQLSMGMTNGVKIIGNTFYLSDVNYQSLSSSSSVVGSAIEVWYSSTLNIKANEIKGFKNGILAINCSNSNIGENNIVDAWHYGVYAKNLSNVDISCNTINMELIDAGTTVGIGIFPQGYVSNSIRGNCIFETSTAIHIEAPYRSNFTSPTIKNNYLYNYTTNGIAFQNVNAGSALGSGLTQATAGKNTFVSNNIPFGAVDINASATSGTTVWGCFGVSTINGPVSLRGGGLYNSTASCGNQIGTINSGIQADEICDQIEGNEHLYPSQVFEERSYVPTEFELQEPTEIEGNNKVNIDLSKLDVYPNPASNEINILINSAESDLATINIYAIDGELVRTVESIGQNVEININIEDLANGAYLVKVFSNENIIGQSKLMVTR